MTTPQSPVSAHEVGEKRKPDVLAMSDEFLLSKLALQCRIGDGRCRFSHADDPVQESKTRARNELSRRLDSVPDQIQAAVKAERERSDGQLEVAWGLIANASGGNWKRESQEWQDAAAKWRDEVMPELSERAAIRSRSEVAK